MGPRPGGKPERHAWGVPTGNGAAARRWGEGTAMFSEDEGAGNAPVFEHALARNLLVGDRGFDVMPEWICLETWSNGSDAKERGRRRRRQPGGHRRRT